MQTVSSYKCVRLKGVEVFNKCAITNYNSIIIKSIFRSDLYYNNRTILLEKPKSYITDRVIVVTDTLHQQNKVRRTLN